MSSKDVNKSLSYTTELDDEVFDENEILTSGNNKKWQKNRSDFFCSKPSI